eukprot:TRINITY_DN7788_c0_g1_i1.p1 TRINITY_DN7788_c0_g1~~TRINITY_DN7788_c0_g1_i1.p1  ORF type:complete len:414 (-),score=75.26 TRINITY_DN7788_c0_g1_i1:73-1314(-)
MNVVIPLGGVGSRFQTDGFLTRPKPFIPILGKPMISWVVDNLSLQSDDALVIIFNPSWMSMNNFMQDILAAKDSRIRLVELPGPTRGAAETVLIGLKALPKEMQKRPTLLADGDTFYTADVVGQFRKVSSSHNAVFCFHDAQPKPIYSYVTTDSSDNVLEVKEKIKISDWANTGCYCFRNGSELASECEELITRGETQLSQDQKGEFYTSGVIAAMIARGAPFRAIKLNRNDFHVLGTPPQVVEWCSSWPQQPKMRIVFDLDGTLLSAPRVPGDLSTCGPIERNLKLCRRLKAQGHHITLWTERPSDTGAVTLDTLRALGVEYDELAFGKPEADFYIDDRCVDPLLGEIDKQIGFYPTSVKVQEASKGVAAAKLRVGNVVATPMPSKDGLVGMAFGLFLGVCLGMGIKERLSK